MPDGRAELHVEIKRLTAERDEARRSALAWALRAAAMERALRTVQRVENNALHATSQKAINAALTPGTWDVREWARGLAQQAASLHHEWEDGHRCTEACVDAIVNAALASPPAAPVTLGASTPNRYRGEAT